jgi:beta-lactamase regulating signal transducer with metallopeptidase domain/DUF4097 and DUF4098 domain-containing protein YvlB
MIALLIKLTVLLAAGWVGAAMLRSQAAALRHLVWTATLAAALALAALHSLLPPLAVPIPGFHTLAAVGGPEPDTGLVKTSSASDDRAIRVDSRSVPDSAVLDSGAEATPAALPDARPLVLAAWLAGVIGVGAWWMLGHIGLVRLAARARPVTATAWRALLHDLLAAGGVRADVDLRHSTDVGSPVVWGVRHPVILLPESADDWSADRRRAVLAHELAHVARRDGLVNAMACIAAALYWFHPLTWVALHRLRIESERACDDLVIARGATGAEYAAHLLEIARGARSLRLAGLSAIGMARPTNLEGRLLAVLDEQRVRGEPRVRTRVLLASALVLGVPLLAASRAVPLAPADTTVRVASAGAKQPGSAIERTLDATNGERLTLDLETGASVTVRGWSEPKAQIRVQLGGRDWAQTRVDIARVDGGVRVHTWIETDDQIQSTSHAIEVMVPQRYDVQLDSAGGDLSLSDLEGNFEGTTGGGSLILSNIRGAADLRTGGGDIHVSDAHLSGSVTSGGGKVELSNVSGGLRGTSGSGPVIYRDAATDDGAGGKEGGMLHISRAGGDITLDDITDGAELETGGGDIRVRRASGDVEASTGGGDIDIRHVAGAVQAGTGAGSVHIEVDELAADGGGIAISTGNGEVVIELPANVAATFDLETAYTDNRGSKTRIEDDWAIPVTETDTWDDSRGTPRKYVRANGAVGGGGPLVKVRAVNGNISVIRR